MTDDRRRDIAIERQWRRLTGPRPTDAAGACPDVEHLALFASASLADEERGPVERHLADCPRCQDTLAVMVRLEEAEQERAREAASATSSWWTAWRRWRWVVPVPVAAALAVTIYVAMRPAPGGDLAPAASVVARHEADAVAPAAEMAAREVEKAPAPAPAEPARSREAPAARPAASVPAFAEEPEAATVASGAMPERRAEQRASAEAPILPALRAAATAEAPAARADRAPGAEAPPAPTSGRALAGAPTALATVTDAAQEAASVTVVTPDPAALWRVDADGRLARTRDGGETWQSVPRPVPQRLLAGACPGVTTCWFVGARGTVVRTTDGATWATIDAPVGDDLVGVEAITADVAIVRTSTASFRTNDGGRTWRPIDR
jgi:hypothetical protein